MLPAVEAGRRLLTLSLWAQVADVKAVTPSIGPLVSTSGTVIEFSDSSMVSYEDRRTDSKQETSEPRGQRRVRVARS
jgi:hypothetical protein